MKLEPIDTSTTAGKARVMQLAGDGRKVSYSARCAPYWCPLGVVENGFGWNWYSCDYGVVVEEAKPVGPDELWVTVINGNVDAGPYTYEVTARDRAQNYGGKAVRYRRVEE